MPDWRQYLRARLGPLGLRHEREEEILAELAEHLEDQCAAKAEKACGWRIVISQPQAHDQHLY